MPNPLFSILRRGILTQRELCPDLPEEAIGLPTVTAEPCEGLVCMRCARACPTGAITVDADAQGGIVTLDRGRCTGCQACITTCPSGALSPDLSTRNAVMTRQDLVLTNRSSTARTSTPPTSIFRRSLHIREVSTGDSASDLEVIACTNPIFDIARFGVHFVASPRFADALLVTGPVGRAMQDPLRRCYGAMATPRIVIAVGVSAISGGVFAGGYAEACGVDAIVPVACYIPGDPPHPWSIVHGILLTMGRMESLADG